MSKPGTQQIDCDVSSCQHNTPSKQCALSAIRVTACSGGCTGKPDDESMCSNYHTK